MISKTGIVKTDDMGETAANVMYVFHQMAKKTCSKTAANTFTCIFMTQPDLNKDDLNPLKHKVHVHISSATAVCSAGILQNLDD